MSEKQKTVEFNFYAITIEDDNEMLMIPTPNARGQLPKEWCKVQTIKIEFPADSKDLDCIVEIEIDTDNRAYFYPKSLGRDQRKCCIFE